MEFKIIDFHTHPFMDNSDNICSHTDFCSMSAENTETDLKKIGISKICGSVICRKGTGNLKNDLDAMLESNKRALALREQYKDFYIPGFHVHPGYIKESCEEIEKMHSAGVNLIGELVPYMHNWQCNYSDKGFDEILDTAKNYNMIISFHSMDEDAMDAMIKKHPSITFVAAHPGEYGEFTRHMERMKMSDNYYLDLSGYGMFRHGMLRHAIDLFGAERFLFGSDYPTCNPAMYIGGVMLDFLLTDKEKELILYENAKNLLNL